MTYHSRHCLSCGCELPKGYRGQTCSQLCRTRLHRRRKAIADAASRCELEIWRLCCEIKNGTQGDLAMKVLLEAAQFMTAAVADPVSIATPAIREVEL